MSSLMQDPQGDASGGAPPSVTPDQTQNPNQDPGQQDDGQDLLRYTIHIPVRDNSGKEIPHVLAKVRETLTASGFPGRTVVRKAQGDWQDFDTEEMDLVMVDAPDDPSTLNTLKTIAQGVKQLAGQEAVYLTAQPLRSYLI